MFYEFLNQAKTEKKSKDVEAKVLKQQKMKIPRFYEFQFYENFEELQDLANTI